MHQAEILETLFFLHKETDINSLDITETFLILVLQGVFGERIIRKSRTSCFVTFTQSLLWWPVNTTSHKLVLPKPSLNTGQFSQKKQQGN